MVTGEIKQLRASGTLVDTGVGDKVFVGDGVLEGVGVCVGVLSMVAVAVGVEVSVTVAVGVEVGVAVGVKVCEGIAEAVGVAVDGAKPFDVDVGVAETAIAEMEVAAGLGFGVEEGDRGKYTNVFVGLGKRAVLVTTTTVVEGANCVATWVPAVGVAKDVLSSGGYWVTLENVAPGVR